jgi:hypothetical protein
MASFNISNVACVIASTILFHPDTFEINTFYFLKCISPKASIIYTYEILTNLNEQLA